jgi:hypothetical protein
MRSVSSAAHDPPVIVFHFLTLIGSVQLTSHILSVATLNERRRSPSTDSAVLPQTHRLWHSCGSLPCFDRLSTVCDSESPAHCECHRSTLCREGLHLLDNACLLRKWRSSHH